MVDAAAFRDGCGRLLADVQRIKAEADYAAAAALFEAHGTHFDAALRDEVVARTEALDLPAYTGFVQPALEPVRDAAARSPTCASRIRATSPHRCCATPIATPRSRPDGAMAVIAAAERPVTPAAEDQAIDYVLRLGRALHAYGYASPALERALVTASTRLGLIGHFFSTPTSIFVAFGTGSAQRTFLTRVEPGGISLGKLADIDGNARAVIDGSLSPSDALARIEAIERQPPPFGPWLETAASGIASGAACRLLGGGEGDVVVGTGLGILVGLLGMAAGRLRLQQGLFELIASALVSAAALLAASFGLGVAPATSTLAGLIIVLPGFSLTIAMTELAARHLVSGTARLAGAFTVFFAITFGVAVGRQLIAALLALPPPARVAPLPEWTLWAAVFATPIAVTVLLQGRTRDMPWIVLASLAGFFGGRAGNALLGPAIGACLGALSVGLAAHAYERWVGRPALVPLVPGVLLLVPGSTGFRSLAALVDQQVVVGIDTAFATLLTAASLVAGLLMAEMIADVSTRLPARLAR